MVVCVRKTIGSLTCAETDSYATIKNISINFNNQAGLLSSMTQEQLYRNSVQSGLANMSWDEFS
ncbi:MAG: major capsid protein V20 domain-containing protein, partial [Candidatus Fonsibacter sp.]